MPTPVRSWLTLASAFLIAALATGCTSNRAFWHALMNDGSHPQTFTVGGAYQKEGLQPPLVLNAEQITNMVVGTQTNGSICVFYGKDLQPQAALVAHVVEQTFNQTEQALESPLSLRPLIYLLRLPNERRVVQFSISMRDTHQTLPWLMLITNPPPESASSSDSRRDVLWADLHDLPIQVFLMAHESCEMRLIDPRELLVMGDPSFSGGFIHFDVKYHTRWFRDGLANYTGYKASQYLRRRLSESGVEISGLQFIHSSLQPFSALMKTREKLFEWNQTSKNDYYDAATALFLLLERRAGAGAITAILHELPNVEFPDGKSLLKMVQKETGVDLRELARTFQFPDLGLEMNPNARGRPEIQKVAANSWGAGAKLLKGDLLLEANACPLAGVTDLEWQVLKAFEGGEKLSLAFSRNGERYVTEAFALPGVEQSRRESKARHIELGPVPGCRVRKQIRGREPSSGLKRALGYTRYYPQNPPSSHSGGNPMTSILKERPIATMVHPCTRYISQGLPFVIRLVTLSQTLFCEMRQPQGSSCGDMFSRLPKSTA